MAYVPYDFFFSYPRAEARSDPYLMRFFDDLSKEICRLRGLDPETRVGYRDEVIDRGADWQRALMAGLTQSRTIVPLYMPSFYNSSDGCMRELELFESRMQGLQRRHTVVKPVFWTTGAVPMPEHLTTFQYTYGSTAAEINQKGVLHALTRNKRLAVRDLVEQLALDIVSAADEQPALPAILGSYERTQPSQVVPLDIEGPAHVHFVYVATSANTLPQQRGPAAYGPAPRSWRPFNPPTAQAIGPMTQEVAGSQEFTSDELHFDQNIVGAMREAERKRNLVVMIVDGWSVRLAPYGEVLRLIDEQNFLNASILVPFNESDAETVAASAELRDAVRSAMEHWLIPADALRFNDTVTTLPQLKTTLADTLTRLRAQVFNRGGGRPTPSVPRPTLTNVGTGI